MINIFTFFIFFTATAIMMYCMFQNIISTITESKWDIHTWIDNSEARLMEDILINKRWLKEINEKVDKLNIKAIEEKKDSIKGGDEIVDENNDFYFVTYVYGDKVDGISKDGIVREGMEMGEVKKTGRHGVVSIRMTTDGKPEYEVQEVNGF